MEVNNGFVFREKFAEFDFRDFVGQIANIKFHEFSNKSAQLTLGSGSVLGKQRT